MVINEKSSSSTPVGLTELLEFLRIRLRKVGNPFFYFMPTLTGRRSLLLRLTKLRLMNNYQKMNEQCSFKIGEV